MASAPGTPDQRDPPRGIPGEEDMPRPREDVIKTTKYSYEVIEILGKGAFGAVFKVKRSGDDKELAMKCESFKTKKQVLRHEAKILVGTSKINSPHITHFEDRGCVKGRFLFIVMRLVGKNLWDLRMDMPGKRFSVTTSMHVAEQSLAAIRDMHRAGFLHRDVKPPNFATGREEDGTFHTVYILDFGMCRRYRTDQKDLRMPRDKAAFRGTTRYASLNTLDMKEQCRKDDLESWWYMIVEMIVGCLPWKHCKGSERAAVRKFKKELRDDPAALEKTLKGTPLQCFKNIFAYLDTIEYAMIPDYDYMYRELRGAYVVHNLNPDAPLDWDPGNNYKGPEYQFDLVEPGEPEPPQKTEAGIANSKTNNHSKEYVVKSKRCDSKPNLEPEKGSVQEYSLDRSSDDVKKQKPKTKGEGSKKGA